jgi:hypothetical protein
MMLSFRIIAAIIIITLVIIPSAGGLLLPKATTQRGDYSIGTAQVPVSVGTAYVPVERFRPRREALYHQEDANIIFKPIVFQETVSIGELEDSKNKNRNGSSTVNMDTKEKATHHTDKRLKQLGSAGSASLQQYIHSALGVGSLLFGCMHYANILCHGSFAEPI